MSEKEGFFRRIRPHVEFEAIKWFVLGGGATMTVALYALYQKARHLGVDWYVFGGMFLVSLFLLSIAWWLSERNKPLAADKEPEANVPSDIPADPSSLLFTPLQIEAFQLAKDLREFRNGFGVKPAYDKTLHESAGTSPAMVDVFIKYETWNAKLTNGYSLRFADKVTRMKHQFGEVGLENRIFDDIEHEVIPLHVAIPDLARDIERLAVDVNYPNLHKLEHKRELSRGGF